MNRLHVSAAVLALGALSFAFGGCATSGGDGASAAALSDTTPVQGREVVLVVFGMSCPLCANNVDQTLLDVPGVTSVTVDMSTGKATVSLDGKTAVTRGQLATAIDKSGFSLQSIETQ
jgi:copper chaperone CopZ